MLNFHQRDMLDLGVSGVWNIPQTIPIPMGENDDLLLLLLLLLLLHFGVPYFQTRPYSVFFFLVFCPSSWIFPNKTTSSCSQFQGQEADATPADDRKFQDQRPALRGASLALFFEKRSLEALAVTGQAMSRADFSRPPIYTVYTWYLGKFHHDLTATEPWNHG